MLTVGSLFSGIGGLEYGLEQTGGFRTIWQSEIDPYAGAVLGKHWAGVPNLGDITKIDWGSVERPDVLCGGFPCQDISVAGKGAGIKEGTRSGLWLEFAKAIRALRPSYVVVENVPMLIKRGMHTVLADLAEAGYDAEWHNISASSVGAWHRRERIFIIAYLHGIGGWAGKEPYGTRAEVALCGGKSESVPDTNSGRLERTGSEGERTEYAFRKNREAGKGIWTTEPGVGRVADGIPSRVDRIKCLGNAVVPQVAQVVGEMILEMESQAQFNEALKETRALLDRTRNEEKQKKEE
jgi:DNA (cytosine-5)-methyltransferase 1